VELNNKLLCMVHVQLNTMNWKNQGRIVKNELGSQQREPKPEA